MVAIIKDIQKKAKLSMGDKSKRYDKKECSVWTKINSVLVRMEWPVF